MQVCLKLQIILNKNKMSDHSKIGKDSHVQIDIHVLGVVKLAKCAPSKRNAARPHQPGHIQEAGAGLPLLCYSEVLYRRL